MKHIDVQVGAFVPLVQKSILTFGDNPIVITIDNLVLNIVFLKDEDEPRALMKFEGKVATLQFFNINRSNSIVGIFEPYEIAYDVDKNPVFFSCVVNTENAQNGNRFVNFIYWKKKSYNE